jgi:hydroxyquinol 1,2-dioxygenase
MISTDGYERLVTHIFVEGKEYLDSDAVIAVKNSLIAKFALNTSTEQAVEYGFKVPFNFGLKTA